MSLEQILIFIGVIGLIVYLHKYTNFFKDINTDKDHDSDSSAIDYGSFDDWKKITTETNLVREKKINSSHIFIIHI